MSDAILIILVAAAFATAIHSSRTCKRLRDQAGDYTVHISAEYVDGTVDACIDIKRVEGDATKVETNVLQWPDEAVRVWAIVKRV